MLVRVCPRQAPLVPPPRRGIIARSIKGCVNDLCANLGSGASRRAVFRRQLTMYRPSRAVFREQLTMCGPPGVVFASTHHVRATTRCVPRQFAMYRHRRAVFRRQLAMSGQPRAVFRHQGCIARPGAACMNLSPIHRPQSSVAAIIGVFECVPEAMFIVLVHSSSIRRVGS